MKIVLLQSLGGNGFSLVPGQLVEASKADAESLVYNGVARLTLASLDEPTELQLASEFTLSKDAEEIEKASEVVEPPPAPTRQRRRNANPSQS